MLNPSIPNDRLTRRDARDRSEKVTAAERVLPVLCPDTVLKAAVITGLVLLLTLLAALPVR